MKNSESGTKIKRLETQALGLILVDGGGKRKGKQWCGFGEKGPLGQMIMIIFWMLL